MKKQTIRSIERKLKAHQDQIAKDRDNLDRTISDLEDLREECHRAWESLQDARDALSELV